MAGVDDIRRCGGKVIGGDGRPIDQIRRRFGDIGVSRTPCHVEPGHAGNPLQGEPRRQRLQGKGVNRLIEDIDEL